MNEVIDFVKNNLSKKRFIHSINVAKIAANFGEIYKIDKERLMIAGLLHDIAKEMSYEEQLDFLNKNKINLTSIDFSCKGILHSYVSAIIAKEKFNIDNEIFNAIYYHSTGQKDLNTFGKIIFISDYLDPSRKLKEQKIIYRIAQKNLDKATIMVIKEKIDYVISDMEVIHYLTVDFYNELIKKLTN